MTYEEIAHDDDLILQLRRTFCDLTTSAPPSLASITSRGRTIRRRKAARVAGVSAGCAAAGTALALAVAAPPGHSTSGGSGTTHLATSVPGSSSGLGSVQPAAFTLSSNANGTVTLSLPMTEMLDPAALQQALTEDGIPALVKTDLYCTSTPSPPDPVGAGVLTTQSPLDGGNAVVKEPTVVAPSSDGASSGVVRQLSALPAQTKTVINPAAIPSGTELFFGYSSSHGGELFADLIYPNSYSCSSSL